MAKKVVVRNCGNCKYWNNQQCKRYPPVLVGITSRDLATPKFPSRTEKCPPCGEYRKA